MNLLQKIRETSNFITEKISVKPDTGIILGSGLGSLGEEIEDAVRIKYSDIPNFPTSTVKGHKGQLVVGKLKGKNVIAMQGRFHYYEGYSLEETTFPVRIFKELGVENLIVTNAAGGVNEDFESGNLMLITEHINFSFDNPLIGKNFDELGPRFPDMSSAYSDELISKALIASQNLKIKLQEGTYMFMSGPSYETPSEIRMARFLGADAVGMSTVPEVIAAKHGAMNVLGISCITNMGAGILNQPLNHEEVIQTSEMVKEKFIALVKEIINIL